MNHRPISQHSPRMSTGRSPLWLPTVILLLGALLRLAAFQEALVGADQSSILAAAADIAALRDFPGVGIKSSIGVMQTAIPAYLAALPLLLVRRVIAVKWFFSILDILAIAALYRTVHRVFGLRTAAVASLLYATNPWVVEFTRWIWYQSLIPTFATLAFAALLSAAIDGANRRPLSIVAAIVCATLMGLVHLAALPWAALLCAVALTIAAIRRRWRAAALGVLGALVVASPYLAFLARGGIADIELVLRSAGEGTAPTGLNTASYRLSMELLSGRQVLATPRNALWSESVLNWEPLYALLPVLLGVSMLWAFGTLVRRGRAGTFPIALTALWALLAPALFLPSTVHLQHFYLLFIFPSPFVLIGAATGALLGKRAPHPVARRVAAVVGTVMLLAVVLLAGWWAHLWIVRIAYEQQGQLRAPTRAWLMDQSVDTIAGYLDSAPSGEVIVLTHFGGESSPFDWIRNFVGSDRVRVVPAGEGLIIPASETCYMVAERASLGQLAPLEGRLVLQPEMTVPASPPWTFHCTGPRPQLPDPQAIWQNGLRLLATEVTGELEPGRDLQLAHTWHYRALTGQEYHFYNHLVTGEELVAQIDGDGVPTRYWRDDDVLITYFTLPLPDALPSGELALRVGAYTWPAIVRVPLEDGGDGFTIAQWVR